MVPYSGLTFSKIRLVNFNAEDGVIVNDYIDDNDEENLGQHHVDHHYNEDIDDLDFGQGSH